MVAEPRPGRPWRRSRPPPLRPSLSPRGCVPLTAQLLPRPGSTVFPLPVGVRRAGARGHSARPSCWQQSPLSSSLSVCFAVGLAHGPGGRGRELPPTPPSGSWLGQHRAWSHTPWPALSGKGKGRGPGTGQQPKTGARRLVPRRHPLTLRVCKIPDTAHRSPEPQAPGEERQGFWGAARPPDRPGRTRGRHFLPGHPSGRPHRRSACLSRCPSWGAPRASSSAATSWLAWCRTGRSRHGVQPGPRGPCSGSPKRTAKRGP